MVGDPLEFVICGRVRRAGVECVGKCGVNGRHRTMVVAPAVPANVIDHHVHTVDLVTLKIQVRCHTRSV